MRRVSISIIVAPLLLAGCTHKVQVEPIKVEPIHVTVDVRVKVDRELESFFDFEEQFEPDAGTDTGPTTTSPQAAPADGDGDGVTTDRTAPARWAGRSF